MSCWSLRHFSPRSAGSARSAGLASFLLGLGRRHRVPGRIPCRRRPTGGLAMMRPAGSVALVFALFGALMFAAPAAAQQSLSLDIGYFDVRGEGSRVAGDTIVANLDATSPFALGYRVSDFNGVTFGAEWLFPLGALFEGGVGVNYYSAHGAELLSRPAEPGERRGHHAGPEAQDGADHGDLPVSAPRAARAHPALRRRGSRNHPVELLREWRFRGCRRTASSTGSTRTRERRWAPVDLRGDAGRPSAAPWRSAARSGISTRPPT